MMVFAEESDDLKATVNARNFLGELKRRKVYRVAVAYALMAWALSQGIAQVLPIFDVPNWVVRSIVVLIALGFPIALVLAWLFDMTPEGIKRTADISPDEAPDIVRRLEAQARQQFVRGYLCALIYAGLGDKNKAVDYLKRDYLNDDNIDTTEIPVDDPMLDLLHGDPRFETLADRTPDVARRSPPIC